MNMFRVGILAVLLCAATTARAESPKKAAAARHFKKAHEHKVASKNYITLAIQCETRNRFKQAETYLALAHREMDRQHAEEKKAEEILLALAKAKAKARSAKQQPSAELAKQ